MKRCLPLSLLFVFGAILLCCRASAEALWYTGDPSRPYGIYYDHIIRPGINERSLFCAFTVTDPQGWTVTDIWSNDALNYTPTEAVWSIRTGMSETNPGTILYGGTSPVDLIPTGFENVPYPTYSVTVPHLQLDLALGMYWMQVTPIGGAGDSSYCGVTTGWNAVGPTMPGNALATLTPTTFGRYRYDFSMGAAGVAKSAIPEPGTLVLLAVGAAGLLGMRKMRVG